MSPDHNTDYNTVHLNSSIDKNSTKKITSELSRILNVPGNNFCADCKGKYPRWASVNIGVVICIDCSGIHRSLGIHISNVKSLSLDFWKQQWIHNLKNIGNDIANGYYEFKLPPNFKRPNHTDNKEALTLFIKNKYEYKLFSPSDHLEPHILISQGKNVSDLLPSPTKEPEKKKNSERKKNNTSKKECKISVGNIENGAKNFLTFKKDDFDLNKDFSSFDKNLEGEAKISNDSLSNGNCKSGSCLALEECFRDKCSPRNSNRNEFLSFSPRGKTSDSSNTRGMDMDNRYDERDMWNAKIAHAKESIDKLFQQPENLGFGSMIYPEMIPDNFADFNVISNTRDRTSIKNNESSGKNSPIRSMLYSNAAHISTDMPKTHGCKTRITGQSTVSDNNTLNDLDAFSLLNVT